MATITERLQESWPQVAIGSAVALAIGYALGSAVGTSSGTSRERAAALLREKQARRQGIVDSRRAVDAALNDLAVRPNPYVITERGVPVKLHGEMRTKRQAQAAVRYLEAIEGGGGYKVKALPARRRRAKAR